MKSRFNTIKRYYRVFLLVCFFTCNLLFLCPVHIAAQKISSRPTVGLVLSGGGAHGIAHLGVIKVMEEAGLRPDYITGVSMGSIIGGMYSLGYSADSLHKILNKINWDLVISNKIPENKVAFVEKDHFDNSIISLPLSFKKVILPSGLINGQQIENTLSFYSWPAADIIDFSKLPIPFMCVATDIITYTKVDLKTGYLPDAIRASSAVPSIFTPLKIDTLLLLDGGLIRNFAASEAVAMGADILIGSYVGFKGYKEDDLQSVSGILKQIAMFRSLNDFDAEKKLCDVIIRPETSEFPIYAFEKVDTFVQRGYEAALPYKEYFRKLADSLDLIGTQETLVNILDKKSYKFNKIEFTGNKRYSDSQILGVMDIRPDEEIDKYLIRDKIELLFGKAWFDKVKYRIVPRNDSLILVIDCIEKPLAMLYGSVHYDNSLLSGLVLGISVKNLITQRSVINMDSYIGQYYRFNLNLLQFVDRNEVLGLSANLYADNTRLPMLEIRGDRGDVVSRNFVPGIGFSQRVGLNQMVGISANYENMNLILRYISNAHLKSLSYNYLSASYYYQINTLDRKQFPDKGIIFNFEAGTSKLLSETVRTDTSKVVFRETKEESSFNRFFTFFGNYEQYFTAPGSKMTLSIGADALFITDSDSVSAQNNFYLLGGFESLNNRSVPMIGFHSNEIPVNKMAGLKTEVDAELFDNFHINIMANIFAVGRIYSNKGFSLLSGYGAGIGYNSIMGPLRIGVMYGNSDREKYFRRLKGYISIGYNF